MAEREKSSDQTYDLRNACIEMGVRALFLEWEEGIQSLNLPVYVMLSHADVMSDQVASKSDDSKKTEFESPM